MAFKMKGFSYPGKSPIKQPEETDLFRRDGTVDMEKMPSAGPELIPMPEEEPLRPADPNQVETPENMDGDKEGFDFGAFRDDVIGTTSEALIQTGIGMAGAAIAKSMQKKEKRQAPVPTFGSGGIGSASKIV